MELSQHTVLGECNLVAAEAKSSGAGICDWPLAKSMGSTSTSTASKSWSLEIANLLALPAQSYDVVYSGASSITPAQCGAHLSM